jgi:hypothetical protein
LCFFAQIKCFRLACDTKPLSYFYAVGVQSLATITFAVNAALASRKCEVVFRDVVFMVMMFVDVMSVVLTLVLCKNEAAKA